MSKVWEDIELGLTDQEAVELEELDTYGVFEPEYARPYDCE